MYARLDSYPRIICIQVPTLSTAVVTQWFQAGARYAPLGKDGLPHLLEHVLFVRNEAYGDKRSYLSEMEKLGFLYNAYTDKSLVDYYFFCAPGSEIHALEQLIGAYQTTLIDDEDIQREKKVVFNEEKRNRASPSQYIWRLMDQSLWPHTELSRDVYGTEETLGSISVEDVVMFRQSFYQPNNMTVIIITPSDIRVDKVNAMVSKFGTQTGLPFKRVTDSGVCREVREQRAGDVVHVGISYRHKALSFHERVGMQFISHYLTGGWSGRLIQRLRLEKGLTYWVASKVHHSYDSGCLQFYYTVKKEHLHSSIEMVKDEINRLCIQGAKRADIANFQRSFIVRNLATAGDPYEMLQYYGRLAFGSETQIYLYDEFIHAIYQLTREDIWEVAKKHLNHEESSIALIGSV